MSRTGAWGLAGMVRPRSGVLVPASSVPQSQRRSRPRSRAVVAVDEDGCAVGFQGWDYMTGSDDDVVVAEDAEALGLEGREDLGADAGGLVGDGDLAGAAADVVAGDEDEVRVEGVDLGDDPLEKEGFGELFKVDVGDLDDAEVEEAVLGGRGWGQ